jgi:hypothetical protein
MANLSHPVDDALIDLSGAIKEVLHVFMRDQQLCSRERAAYDRLRQAHAVIAQDRRIEQAFHYYQHNPTAPSAYGLRKLADAGLEVISLDEKRNERKIVQFPTEPEFG